MRCSPQSHTKIYCTLKEKNRQILIFLWGGGTFLYNWNVNNTVCNLHSNLSTSIHWSFFADFYSDSIQYIIRRIADKSSCIDILNMYFIMPKFASGIWGSIFALLIKLAVMVVQPCNIAKSGIGHEAVSLVRTDLRFSRKRPRGCIPRQHRLEVFTE